MRFSKEEIVSIAGDNMEATTLDSPSSLEWIDLVGIPQRPESLKENLYFATHSQGEGGWNYPFDRRQVALAVHRDRGWPLVVESGLELGGAEYLQVRSLEQLAENIYEVSRQRTNPYIVGVTGSVGKTTSVAFIEHILRTSGEKVARFYSKRLTPLSVMCHYINRVDTDTPYVAMEYSAYMQDHVEELSKLLPPNISFLTNVYDTHLNPGMFGSTREIYNSKIRIKPQRGTGYINGRVLSNLGLETPYGWSTFTVESPEGVSNSVLPPTLRTAEMYTVGKVFTQEVGLPLKVLSRAYETFLPAEKRIVLCNVRGKPIYFHGETSGGSRLWSWFETMDGSVPNFFVEKVDFADEDPLGFVSLLKPIFDSDRTYVLDTPLNRERLPVSGNFFSQEDFFTRLSESSGYTVYHKALASREYTFDPQSYLETIA